MLVELMQVVKD